MAKKPPPSPLRRGRPAPPPASLPVGPAARPASGGAVLTRIAIGVTLGIAAALVVTAGTVLGVRMLGRSPQQLATAAPVIPSPKLPAASPAPGALIEPAPPAS